MKLLPGPERQSESGRTLLMKFGDATHRGGKLMFILFWVSAISVALFVDAEPKNRFNGILALALIVSLLVSAVAAVRGWMGYTKLSLENQKRWGFVGIAISVAYIWWMTADNNPANDYMNDRIWRDGQ